MAKTLRTWGVQYQPRNPDMPHGIDYKCLECEWDYITAKNRDGGVVGFHMLDVPEYGVLEGSKKVAIQIVECLNCFSKFWVHVIQGTAESIMERSANWPED